MWKPEPLYATGGAADALLSRGVTLSMIAAYRERLLKKSARARK
jgi:hypothetical protein